jgi:uncharacterized protein YdcH (DUF465 family)
MRVRAARLKLKRRASGVQRLYHEHDKLDEQIHNGKHGMDID